MTKRSNDLAISRNSLQGLLNQPGHYPPVPAELKDLIGRSMIDYVANPGTVYHGHDFARMPAKRAKFKKCRFQQCDFTEIGAASSSWEGGEFKGCQFRNANFQYARLTDARSR